MEFDKAKVELSCIRNETWKELFNARDAGKNTKDIECRLDCLNFAIKCIKIAEKIKGSFFIGMFVMAILILLINIIYKL